MQARDHARPQGGRQARRAHKQAGDRGRRTLGAAPDSMTSRTSTASAVRGTIAPRQRARAASTPWYSTRLTRGHGVNTVIRSNSSTGSKRRRVVPSAQRCRTSARSRRHSSGSVAPGPGAGAARSGTRAPTDRWGELDRLPCAIKVLPNPKKTMGFHDVEEYERLLTVAQKRSRKAYLMVAVRWGGWRDTRICPRRSGTCT